MAITVTKSQVTAEEKLAPFTKNHDRDEFQREMDGEIAALVRQWLDAEKVPPAKPGETRPIPAEGAVKVSEDKRPKARYHVDPKDKNAFKDVLRRAGTINKVEVVFLYPAGSTKDPVDEKTGKAAVTLTVGPRSTKRVH